MEPEPRGSRRVGTGTMQAAGKHHRLVPTTPATRFTTLALVLGSLLFVRIDSYAQATTVFAGLPSVRINDSGVERVVEKMDQLAASNFRVVISEIDGRYYWASRENKELRVHTAGSFMTFSAVDGSGYVRVLRPGIFKDAAALVWSSAKEFDYVEHLVIGLDSVTYYGTKR